MRSWQLLLIVCVVALLALFYEGLWGDPRAIPTVLIGTQAPLIVGPDVFTGDMLTTEQFRGKVMLVNFWASWCLECKIEHKSLLEINKRFGPHPDFVMLGVNYQDTPENARRYLKEYGNSFIHIRDVKGAIAIDYGVYGVPESFVVDQDGKIVYKYIGPLIGQTFADLTQKILQPLLQESSSQIL